MPRRRSALRQPWGQRLRERLSMGDTQTTKAAETTRVKHKTEDRLPHEREYAPRVLAEATLFRAAAGDDPRTPPQHMARVLRGLTAPQQTTFLLQCQRHYGNAY